MHLSRQEVILSPYKSSKTASFRLDPKYQVTLLGTLLAILSVMLSLSKTALAQVRASAAPLLQVDGVLQSGDAVLEDNSLYDTYTFEGEIGQTVTLTLESNQFDSYLLLVNQQGQTIAENDDISGENRNSSITAVLPESGTYRVLANSYDDSGRGTYRLVVRLAQSNGSTARIMQVPAEGVINADHLVTINGISWAGQGWGFSRVLEIQRDSLDATIVGRVVLDRYGEDTQPLLGISAPFASPRPGRAVVVSTWGSNNSGCFVELILQVATTPGEIDTSLFVPTQIEMISNGQRLTLTAAQNAGAARHQSNRYTYSDWETQDDQLVEVNYPGVWVMTRHLFPVNAEQARLLANAPDQDTPIRVTLTNRSPITFDIGDGTVQRWSNVYSYNPSCAPR